MGMYNELNNISRAVNGQTIQKRKNEEYKKTLAELKIEIKDLLQLELFEGLKNNENIFDIDYKMHTISNILNDYKQNQNFIGIFSKYERDIKTYLLSNYYSIANQSRLIHQRTNTEATKQQQLKNDILEIKKQQEAEKLKKLQQKPMQKQKQKDGLQVLGILLSIVCFPIGIVLLIILSAAKHQK